jgi:hypothetical protein
MSVFELNHWEKKNNCVPGQFDSQPLSTLIRLPGFKMHIEWYNVPGEEYLYWEEDSIAVQASTDIIPPADIPLPESESPSSPDVSLRSIVSTTIYSKHLIYN